MCNKSKNNIYSSFDNNETYDNEPKFELLDKVQGAMDDYHKRMNKIQHKKNGNNGKNNNNGNQECNRNNSRAWDSVEGVYDRYYTPNENSERNQIEFDNLGFANSKLYDTDKSYIIDKLNIVDDVLKNDNLITNDFSDPYKRCFPTIQNNKNMPYALGIEKGIQETEKKLKNRDPVADRFWQDSSLLGSGPNTRIPAIKNEQPFENQFQYLDSNYNRVPDPRLSGSSTRFQNRSTFKL